MILFLFIPIFIIGLTVGAIVYVINKFISNPLFLAIMYVISSAYIYLLTTSYTFLAFLIFAIPTHIALRKVDKLHVKKTP